MINDTGNEFVVIDAEAQYVEVSRPDGSFRRRLLRSSLRTSEKRSGYTQIVTD